MTFPTINLTRENFNYFPNDKSAKGKTDEAWMRNLVPFAVVGSNSIIEVFLITVTVMMMAMAMTMMIMMMLMIIIIFRMKMEESRGVGAIPGALLILKNDSIAISR